MNNSVVIAGGGARGGRGGYKGINGDGWRLGVLNTRYKCID